MEFDAVTIVLAIVILAVLVWAFRTARRDAHRARAGEGLSGWRGSAVWLGVFGGTFVGSHPDGDPRAGDDHGFGGDHGLGGDHAGGHGGGDFGGGGGWGGGDFGGGGGDGGGGGN